MIEARKSWRARAGVSCRAKSQRAPQIARAQNHGGREINLAVHFQQEWAEADDEQSERVADGLLRRAAAVGVHVRQHEKPALAYSSR